MIIAIDPQSDCHGVAMGYLENGQPKCSRTWTIKRIIERTKNKKRVVSLHPNYREEICDLVAMAKKYEAMTVLEDVYFAQNTDPKKKRQNPLTYRRLIESRCEITVPLWMENAPYSLVLLSVWAPGIGIPTSVGSDEIKRRYIAFARPFAMSSGIVWPEKSDHECAAMGILWWSLTTMIGGKK